MLPTECLHDRPHRWNPHSGWCANGCGWRHEGWSTVQATRQKNWRHQQDTAFVDITEPRRSIGMN